jgi:UDP-N-acetylmuramyl pentapeptide synthase
VAITGSAGKTTAKELAAHVLRASGRRILSNEKNFNNGLGHPLTVLNLGEDKTYDAAVLEMGMSTPNNEIRASLPHYAAGCRGRIESFAGSRRTSRLD